MTDLFTEAARDVEAEHLAERCALAKVAVAELWPFLALAQSTTEFEHRLELARDHIATKVDPDLMEITTTALKADFVELTGLRGPDPQPEPVRATAGTRVTALQPGQQIFHHALQRWITVQAADLPHQPATRDNPYGQGDSYFENAAEEGPATGQTGNYPQFPAGPDPVDPLNSMFPMQPSAWTVPPNAAWVENPMNLTPGAGKSASRPGVQNLDPGRFVARPARGDATTGDQGPQGTSVAMQAARRVLAGAGYVGEGVQNGPGGNPNFFGGGSEGVGGDPQGGYPDDLAVEDPDDRVNELYGALPPQPSSGSGQGGAQPYSNPATRTSSFFDPGDAGVRVVAQTGDTDTSGGGMAPQPPQSMMPGGVGSVAQEPLQSGSGMGDAMDPGGADLANKQPTMARRRIDPIMIARMAADNIRQRPSDWNPSGVADEYDDRTWEGAATTRPRQPAEDRAINTPQTPRDSIPQTSSSDIQRDLSEDEERLRQARRIDREQRLVSQIASRAAGQAGLLVSGGAR